MSKTTNEFDNYTDYLNFFNMDNPLDEDNDDEDYNVLEDILTNKGNCEDEPYYCSITKKELNDIMNDPIQSENRLMNRIDINNNNSNFISHKTNRTHNVNSKQNSPNKNFGFNFNNSNNNSQNQVKKNKKRKERKVKTNKKENLVFASPIKENKTINCSSNNVNKTYDNYKNNNNINCNDMSINENEHSKKEDNNVMNMNNNYQNKEENNNNDTKPIQNKLKYIDTLKEENKVLNQMDLIEKLIFSLKQYDLFIQLLIQNLMLADNRNLKYKCYSILFCFYLARQNILESLRFPSFGIKFNFNQIFTQNKEMNLSLQSSFFQPPILEILPILTQFVHKKTFSKEETIKILKEFFPFINPLYLPLTSKFRHSIYYQPKITNINDSDNKENGSNTSSSKKKIRKKFDQISDNLLLIALKHHGKKNIEAIQQFWLPGRSLEEIKHRIKNLTCQSAPDNIIKKYKKCTETMLSKEEFHLFLKGIEWFGYKNKWNVISRYFLPDRSASYLEEFFFMLIENKVLFNDKQNDEQVKYRLELRKNKKKNIIINTELLEQYKQYYSNEINSLSKSITSIELKSKFYTPEETYEHFDIPNKRNALNDNYINTRNKLNQNNQMLHNNMCINTSINEINNNNNAMKNLNNEQNINTVSITQTHNKPFHKNKNYTFDFQIENVDDDTYEKITI